MNDAKSLLWIGALVAHAATAVTLLILVLQAPAMALFCLVAGALIGCAGVPTVPDRPVTVYTAFGVLMGYGFWVAVSAINQRVPLSLLPALLLVTGAVWLLKQPSWPSTLFCVAAVIFIVGLAILQYRGRHEADDFDQDHIRRSALISLIVPSVGLVYVGLGFAQYSLGKPRKKKRLTLRR